MPVGLCVLLFMGLILVGEPVSAQSIAFFPLLDLSVDANGINTQLTARVRRELLGQGKQLVAEEDIMQFLARNRIRTLGQLTSYHAALVRKDLKAELMLQGTICQIADGDHSVLSLNLQLSRTSDRQIIWAQTENISFADLTSLLGLNDPHNLENVFAPFFKNLFSTMPALVETGDEAPNAINLATVLIQPRYLRSGEPLSCTVRMRDAMNQAASLPEMHLLAGGQEYPLVLDEESSELRASWTAAQKAGNYPVTLVTHWPTGVAHTREIGSYTVDDEEPGVVLHVLGTELNGEILFADQLIIIPKLINPEPIVRWQISAIDHEDQAIVTIDESGHVPRNLTWKGKTSLGSVAAPGEYLIRFKAWDRAERESSAETKVRFLPKPPEITLNVAGDQDRIVVDIANIVDTPLRFWFAKFYEENGRLLKLAQGTELPAAVQLETEFNREHKIQCLLKARDILGNETQQNIPSLFKLAEKAVEEETKGDTEWVEEF